MSKTKIEWTEHTWNPVHGCSRISPGCDHCYANAMARRLAGRNGYPEYPHHFDVTLRPDRLEEPLRRKKPTMYFVCSMADLFHKDVPDRFILEVWRVMNEASQHTFQVLTKRPERMEVFVNHLVVDTRDGKPQLSTARLPRPSLQYTADNVWVGVTVENQDRMSRIDALVNTRAVARFVSHEPLLSAIDYNDHLIGPRDGSHGESALKLGLIDQVICGAETGHGKRQMNLDWARRLRDQCAGTDATFFFKKDSDGKRLLDGVKYTEKFTVIKRKKNLGRLL